MRTPQAFLLPDKPVESLDAYIAGGGGEALKQALTMPREQIIAEVKNQVCAVEVELGSRRG